MPQHVDAREARNNLFKQLQALGHQKVYATMAFAFAAVLFMSVWAA